MSDDRKPIGLPVYFNTPTTIAQQAEADRVLKSTTERTPDRLKVRTSINAFECEWPIELWRLYYTYVDRDDEKLYDRVGVVTACNYYTPRPAEDEYNRGSNTEGFTVTIANRHVYPVLIARHSVGSGEWSRLMAFRTHYKALEARAKGGR
jgi:hypothetical protein